MTLREYMLLFRQLKHRERRTDIRNARLMALIANCLAKRKGHKPFTPEDFMPQGRPKKQQPMRWQDMKRIAQDVTVALGGKVQTGEEG